MKISMTISLFALAFFLATPAGLHAAGEPPEPSAERPEALPPPEAISTGDYLIGAFRCSLWNHDSRPDCWTPILAYPERQPLLGWYDEGNPEVTDWEIKYAVEHGISFFVECWFRKKGNAGKPVEYTLGHWLDSLPQAQFRDRIKFMVMWENLNAIASGVASEADLLENLMPFWIEHYFKQPNYLLLEGKPVLMIYGYERFIKQLGGPEAAAAAIVKMRQACVDAGFKGLWLLAEYHNHIAKEIPQPRLVGFDVITSYHWPSFSGLMPTVPASKAEIIDLQERCWSELETISQLPAIPTLSMGWDSRPWNNSYYKSQWYLDPELFKQLCRKVQQRIDREPQPNPFSKIVLLDNWNEYGEGHFIFPTRQFGFGYLDAVRDVFTTAPELHRDLVPADLGRGPYEAQ